MALDALGGDPEFLTNTCDCRATLQAQRESRNIRSNSTAIKPDGMMQGASDTPLSASEEVSDEIDANDGEEMEVQGAIAEPEEDEVAEME